MTLEKAKEIVENEISNICDKELSKAWDTVLRELEILQCNYDTLRKDIAQVIKELGLPEDTIIADEMVEFIKEKYIPKEKAIEKIKDLQENNNGDDYNLANVVNILKELLGE